MPQPEYYENSKERVMTLRVFSSMSVYHIMMALRVKEVKDDSTVPSDK